MEPQFKEIKEQDFSIIKEIYDYYVLHSTATFHCKPVSINELKKVIYTNHTKYKSYLIYLNEQICGYCYFSPYKNRQAYARTAEVTIYLKHGFEGRGIGRKTLDFIEKKASDSGRE